MNGLNGKFPALVVQAIIIISSVVAATLWITGAVSKVDDKILVVRDSVVALRSAVDVRVTAVEGQVSDRWTSSHQRMFSQRLKESNPELKVPWVDDVLRDSERRGR